MYEEANVQANVFCSSYVYLRYINNTVNGTWIVVNLHLKYYPLPHCGMDMLFPFFFCLDYVNDFIISDHSTHSIRFFSHNANSYIR